MLSDLLIDTQTGAIQTEAIQIEAIQIEDAQSALTKTIRANQPQIKRIRTKRIRTKRIQIGSAQPESKAIALLHNRLHNRLQDPVRLRIRFPLVITTTSRRAQSRRDRNPRLNRLRPDRFIPHRLSLVLISLLPIHRDRPLANLLISPLGNRNRLSPLRLAANLRLI